MFLKSCFDCWVEIVEGKGKGWKPETNKEGIVVILVKKIIVTCVIVVICELRREGLIWDIYFGGQC